MDTKEETIRKKILEIKTSSSDANIILNELSIFLSTLKFDENAEGIILTCDEAITQANKIDRSDLIAQFNIMKANAELNKAGILICEMKNLIMGLGWFKHALKSEKQKYEELDKMINEIWKKAQIYLNTAFEHLNKKPFVEAVAYCYQKSAEIYAAFFLQFNLYFFKPKRPWRSKISNLKIIKFLGLNNSLIIDKTIRVRTYKLKKDCIKYLEKACELFRQQKQWYYLANCYLTLSIEHRSFYNPFRSKLAIFKAKKLIKKYKILGLEEKMHSATSRSVIGIIDD